MADTELRPRTWSIGWGVFCLVGSVGLVVVGVLLFDLNAPKHIDLVSLQWSGSASSVVRLVHVRLGPYRTGLYWDFPLIVGYTAGLLLASYVGRRVFWTAGLLRWALVGYFAAGLAGLANVVQDALLLRALQARPIHGTWIFRIAAATSFVKFTALLVVAPIGMVAIATCFARLSTHRSVQRRWQHASKAVGEVPDRIIPPAPIESDWSTSSAEGSGGLRGQAGFRGMGTVAEVRVGCVDSVRVVVVG